jgi:hypothetical protein
MRSAARRRPRGLVLALTLLLAFGLLGRLWYVHDRTWDWSLVISATPPKIQFADRTYIRSSFDEAVPAAAVDVGRTLGGGEILSDHWPATFMPGVIWVRDGVRTAMYALSGGP